MPIATRLYLEDSGLLEFRARVTDIREYARKDGVQVWQIALDRTAFYPMGGGQPSDRGTLRARARSGAELALTVEDVSEDDAGEVWHTTSKPVLTGTEVEGSVDWPRRLDHMQQHSGQHLLSAVLWEGWGLQTVSFHLGEQDATIDVASETPEALAGELAAVEERVNRLIASDLPVSNRVVSQGEAQHLLESGAVRKLPPREGEIRLIEMAGVDLNACGGTHVRALGEIGGLLLRGVERVKKAVRLHFVCGLRAVRAARADQQELEAAAGALSVGSLGVKEAVRRLQAENKALSKERQRLREDVTTRHAVQLAVEERIEDGLRLVCRSFADRDAEYVKLLAMRLMQAVPHTVAVLVSTAEEPATLVVASNLVSGAVAGRAGLGAGADAAASGRRAGSARVPEQEEALAWHCGELLRAVLTPLGLRGGGTAELAQTQVSGEMVADVAEALRMRLVGG
ncbi:alanyl-tRNA editing protein [Acidipila sp. EB88]|uniref:alanyl-tRNA editing protein n=1 Tax=Acidipila sp. EB88 TaxID=2305226 RepID=UPI000F5E622C|nr:alanyl-tRNA editing protein [Acidipila sp. EB88]RRA48661.1 alanyl-tRNA editing protein [Acidipila sp. EB88]